MNLPLTLSTAAELVTALAAIGALVGSIHNRNAIQEVHLLVNSRLTELISAANAQGRQDERDDHAAKPKR